jgi:homoserine kinase
MTKSQVTAFAPATIANVGPGFDIFGLALNAPGDQVLVKKSSIPGIRITRITGDQGRLPYDITKNSAGVTALAFCNSLGLENERLEIEIYKGMPLGSGLGSSAASAVATVKALNALYGNPHSETTLLEFAKEGERIACGTPHLDNIAP